MLGSPESGMGSRDRMASGGLSVAARAFAALRVSLSREAIDDEPRSSTG